MKRHELTDQQWELIAPFFPPRPCRRGGQWKDDRTMLNAIFWRLNTGAPWRDLPERYGPIKRSTTASPGCAALVCSTGFCKPCNATSTSAA